MALGHLGPVRLSSLNENRPDRKELDAVFPGVKQGMLERGLWYFALRTAEFIVDPDIDPQFGLPYAFSIPDDYVRLRKISPDADQTTEDESFQREGRHIYSNHAQLYITYVSNHQNYGGDLGKFTQLYAEAFAAELAYQSGLPITKDRGSKNDLMIVKQRMLVQAKRLEAVDERVKTKRASSWVQSRLSRNRSQRREAT